MFLTWYVLSYQTHMHQWYPVGIC